MNCQLDLEKSYWVQSNLASTWLEPIFSLCFIFLFDKIIQTKLSANNLNELDSLDSNCWVSKILDQLN